MTIYPILVGGLGNRLYQIANALRIGEELNCDVKFSRVIATNNDVNNFRHLAIRTEDFSDFGGHPLITKSGLPSTINDIFPNLSFSENQHYISDIINNKQIFFEHNINQLSTGKDCVIMGYYFGYRFVSSQINKLKSHFNPIIDEYINLTYPELISKKIFGIHLRLGIGSDNNPAIEVPIEYYNSIIKKEYNNFDEIYIISDNVEKSKNFIYNLDIGDKPIKVINDEPMYVDMLILSKCSILSIAPSTLSAWSSYFNEYKNIYVPKIWTHHHWTNDIAKEWKLY
jgi:hypothetical protein